MCAPPLSFSLFGLGMLVMGGVRRYIPLVGETGGEICCRQSCFALHFGLPGRAASRSVCVFSGSADLGKRRGETATGGRADSAAGFLLSARWDIDSAAFVDVGFIFVLMCRGLVALCVFVSYGVSGGVGVGVSVSPPRRETRVRKVSFS